MENKGPIKKIKAGSISATIWENKNQNNKGEDISYMSITLDRSYKDANGEWKKTNSFRAADIPKAGLALSKAYEFLTMSSEEEY